VRLSARPGFAELGSLTAIAVLTCLVSACVGVSVRLTFAPDPTFAPTVLDSEEGRFSVEGPTSFQETVRTIENPYLGPIEVHFFLAKTPGGAELGVAYGDYPQSYIDSTDLATIYQEAVDGDVGATKATLISSKDVAVDGHPSNEHILSGPRGTYRFVTIVVGRRLYSVSAIGSEDALARPEVDRFFVSFVPEP
jgi:hypothetical protein